MPAITVFSSDHSATKILEKRERSDDARLYEYSSAANPDIPQIPVLALEARLHESGATRVIPFDLSQQLRTPYPASSPNLLASFIRINPGESLITHVNATSQVFYVIRGSGRSVWPTSSNKPSDSDDISHSQFSWKAGDLFVLPAIAVNSCEHFADNDVTQDTNPSGVALYWVHDAPLLSYLGVSASVAKFQPTIFLREQMLAEVDRIRHDAADGVHRNRLGVLLGNKVTESSTKTLTHTMWSLLNTIPGKDAQRPHRHNSVALDLCVYAPPGEMVYTLMGPELDEHGWVKNPIKCVWKTGAVFTTPPGWWHSHHNESDEAAWVLPVQDAGLFTYQRTLDIRFSE